MVSKASEDFPLPLGPVTTVNFPSGRSRSMPLRLFWRASRISTQPRSAGAMTQFFSTTFEPTGNYPRCDRASQILPAKPHVIPNEVRDLTEANRSRRITCVLHLGSEFPRIKTRVIPKEVRDHAEAAGSHKLNLCVPS